MKTAQETLKTYHATSHHPRGFDLWNEQSIEMAMKEYARQVGEQVRLECSENAKIKRDLNKGHEYAEVDKQSILSIDLNQFIR